MPESIPVELVLHSPDWAAQAKAEGDRLSASLGSIIVCVHHIGSTSIPGIQAKPIIDLIPVVTGLEELDNAAPELLALGYAWWGEYGISNRRYLTLDDRETGRRRIQLHCFQANHPEIEKHLSFRDYLRNHRQAALEYEAEKVRCRDLHRNDSHAYCDAKAAWIAAHLPAALSYYRTRAQSDTVTC